jgi:hypothetical protein
LYFCRGQKINFRSAHQSAAFFSSSLATSVRISKIEINGK